MTKVILSAPAEYAGLSKDEKTEICNGCGAKGGIPVPNSFLGLDISEACNIHDYMYYIGETWQDKKFADNEFLKNLLTIIHDVEYWDSFDPIREAEAFAYVTVVRQWGDDAYVADKNIKAKS